MRTPSCPSRLIAVMLLGTTVTILCGCSSSHAVRSSGSGEGYSHEQLNDELVGCDATIEFKNGDQAIGRGLRIGNDSLSYSDLKTDVHSRVSLTQVKRIVTTSHLRGGVDGLVLGLLGGAVLGTTTGCVLWITVDDGIPSHLGAYLLYGVVLGGGAGLFSGIPAGLIFGHDYSYEFP